MSGKEEEQNKLYLPHDEHRITIVLAGRLEKVKKE
jgi:hypothetical protein